MGKFTISSCLTLLAFGITICLTLSGCSPRAVRFLGLTAYRPIRPSPREAAEQQA